MIGSFSHYRLGNLKIKSALVFAFPSILSLLLTRKIVLSLIPDTLFSIGDFDVAKDLLIIMVFAFLMIATSISMIKKSIKIKETKQINFPILALIGFFVGLIIVFFGSRRRIFDHSRFAFFFANLPMKEAVGASLFIIFINSFIGFWWRFAW